MNHALGRLVQAPQQMQQGAFTRTRGTDDGQGFARTHLQVYALQHGHIESAFGKALGQALGLQHEIIHSAAPVPG